MPTTMKKIKTFLVLSACMLVMNSCIDFEELEKNENKPAQVPPSLVLNGIENDMYEAPWSLGHRQNQFWCCNYNYYGTNEYWSNASFASFQSLRNIQKMESEAKRTGAPDINPYSALGKFFRAYFFVRMTQQMGDVPMTEALKGLENPTPVYDSQKEIYQQVLVWLEEANADLKKLDTENDLTLAGDFYLGNDLGQWRKAVNTFALRVLISLSEQNDDADLNVEDRFASIVNNPSEYPVMIAPKDNMQYIYNGTTNLYPTNPGNRGFDKGRYNMAQTYVKALTDLHDPRVYVTCNPAESKIAGGVDPADFAAYVGAPSGENLADMTVKAGNGEYSFANQLRYYGTTKGPEPGVLISYHELCFNIAEGINRGWVPGKTAADAEIYYKAGIAASMLFYDLKDGASVTITEPDEDAPLKTVTVSVTDYLAQPSVEYSGNNATGLSQILTQKYISLFQQSGFEAYFNYRRTGIPAFHSGPGTGNNSTIPKRWLYPTTEKNVNLDNLNDAVSSQFGAEGDNLNSELWLNQD